MMKRKETTYSRGKGRIIQRSGYRPFPRRIKTGGLVVAGGVFFVLAILLGEQGIGTGIPTVYASSLHRIYDADVKAFQNSKGVPLITNRPGKYINNPAYRPYKIKFDRIVVPKYFEHKPTHRIVVSSDIQEIVEHYARLYGLDSSLIFSIIRVESNFDSQAVSRAGAQGLMQLMPQTAREMGVRDPFDPAQNIAGGTQYLSKLLHLFNGNLPLALAAYNAGPDAVRKYKGIPPYRETRNYVNRVRYYASLIKRHGLQIVNSPLQERFTGKVKAIPDKDKTYVIHFTDGLAQPCDDVIGNNADTPYFWIKFQGFTRRIRKEKVKRIEAV